MKYRYSGNPKHQTGGLRATTGTTNKNNIRFHVGSSIKEGPENVKAGFASTFRPSNQGNAHQPLVATYTST